MDKAKAAAGSRQVTGQRSGRRAGTAATAARDGNQSRAAKQRFVLHRATQFHVLALALRFSQHVARYYRNQHAISIGAWRVLAHLAEAEPLSAKDVSERTIMNPFRVTRAIAQLEAKGLVDRSFDKRDRRRIELRLTPAGRAVHEDVLPHVIAGLSDLYSVLTPEEHEAFVTALSKLEKRSIELFGSVPPSTDGED
jgi:DNA-binding MarR family transcriptional regulator